MNIKVISEDFSSSIFNTVAPHPLQSWEWGEAREKMGIDIMRIGEFSSEQLQNVFQLTFHPIPYTNFKVGYLPRSVMPSADVMNVLKEEARKRNVVFIKMEPYIQKRLIMSNQNGIVDSPHPLFPRWTQILDLTLSEDEMLKKMKPKTRYNIGLAKRKGVTVRKMSDEKGFEIFSKLYFETTSRQGYRGHNEAYHRLVFETLKNNIAHIFVAFYKNTPLSSFEVFTFNDVLYYPYGGSSEEYRNVMAPHLLMWEVIRFGKQAGCKKFDMWGSLPPNYNEAADWGGFTRFKQGFGGEFVEFIGSYDIVLNGPLYALYNFAHSIRTRLI